MKKTFIVIMVALLMVGAAQAQGLHVGYMSIAAKGMGGNYVAYDRDATVTLTNPALLNRAGFNLTLVSVPISMDTDVTDIVAFASDNSDALGNFADATSDEQAALLKDMESFDDKWANIGVSPFLGITLPVINLGVAVYTDFRPAVKVDQGVFIPAVGFRGAADIGAAVGMGREIMGYEVGATIRMYERRTLPRERVAAGDMASIGDIASKAFEDIEEGEAGFGIDLGIVKDLPVPGLTGAVAIQDAYGSQDGYIVPNLTTGIKFTPPVVSNVPFTPKVALCADITDWFNSEGVAFFQRINAGAEVKLPILLDLRAGVHQGYPTFGLGIKLLLFNIDYAYFGRESGSRLGQNPDYSHNIGLTVGF